MQDKEYFKQGPGMKIRHKKSQWDDYKTIEFKTQGRGCLPEIEFFAGPGPRRFFMYKGKLLWVNHWA